MKTGKIILGAGIGAGVIWLVNYLAGKKKVGDKLDTLTRASVHSVSLTGLTLRIDVTLKNPTEYTLRLKQPYIRILYQNKLVATSQLENKIIELPKYGVKLLDAIFITIPATGLLTLGDGLFKVVMKKVSAKITTITLTSIDIGGRFIAYEKTDVMDLKPRA